MEPSSSKLVNKNLLAIAVSIINHSEIGVICTNLAVVLRGPHTVGFHKIVTKPLDFHRLFPLSRLCFPQLGQHQNGTIRGAPKP